jgi:dolichol-phosphate mannosyltransferase
LKALVIVPTYNERENISRFLDEVLKKGVDVLVVDDASPDRTAGVVKDHPMFGKRVHLIERPKKLGLGSAYVEGFRWALAMGYDPILEMDADFSHNPDDIPRMIDMSRQYDLVIGSRYVAGANVVNWPLRRLLLSYFANLYARVMVFMWDIKDITGGFKCYRRRVIEAMPLDRIESDGYGFQIETNFLSRQKGFSIVEIPIVFTERRAGMSKMSKRIIWEAFWLVLRLSFRKVFRKGDP